MFESEYGSKEYEKHKEKVDRLYNKAASRGLTGEIEDIFEKQQSEYFKENQPPKLIDPTELEFDVDEDIGIWGQKQPIEIVGPKRHSKVKEWKDE